MALSGNSLQAAEAEWGVLCKQLDGKVLYIAVLLHIKRWTTF
jgi:hypothetical protein